MTLRPYESPEQVRDRLLEHELRTPNPDPEVERKIWDDARVGAQEFLTQQYTMSKKDCFTLVTALQLLHNEEFSTLRGGERVSMIARQLPMALRVPFCVATSPHREAMRAVCDADEIALYEALGAYLLKRIGGHKDAGVIEEFVQRVPESHRDAFLATARNCEYWLDAVKTTAESPAAE